MTYRRHERHFRTPVAVGPYEIRASGYTERWLGDSPVAALFLDRWWEHTAATFTGSDIRVEHWPDMSAVPSRYLAELVEWVGERLESGGGVDIACIAGHGRTGTMIAALIARYEGLGGEAAVEQTRSRYCGLAVETREQEAIVAEYAKYLGQAAPRAARTEMA